MDDDDQNNQQSYSWEEKYKRSWDLLQEDSTGSLSSVISALQQQLLKKKRILIESAKVLRGIIRYVYIILDASVAMNELDLKPNRMDFSISLLGLFLLEFFDQNPLGQVGIVITRDGLAEKISELSGNPTDLRKILADKDLRNTRGEPSLQNALELAANSLCHVPNHGSREIIALYGSLTSCDPSDISDTLDRLLKDKIRVSMVGLSAEVQICKHICQSTGGNYGVLLDEAHFKELLFQNISPPPLSSTQKSSSLIHMGFPQNQSFSSFNLCSCHQTPVKRGFSCPRCEAIVCDIPMDCPICSLSLVSSPFLARSYHHLFPVQLFQELELSVPNLQNQCYACITSFPQIPKKSKEILSGRFACTLCKNQFCLDCDIYIHQTLHACPGCK